MPKFHAALLILCLIFMGQSINSSALNSNSETDKSVITGLNLKVAGGTVYVPAKMVFLSRGWEVTWFAKEKMIIAVKGNEKVILKIDSKKAIINGEDVELSGIVRIIDNESYIPVDFAAQKFGEKVIWDKKGNIIMAGPDFESNVIVNGHGNIIIAKAKGVILDILEPISSDTAYDLLRAADTLLENNNIPEAIEKYKTVLENVSKEGNPSYYAHASKGMGDAYSILAQIKDTKANIEKAISLYENAVSIYFAENNPVDYYHTLNNLGSAYKVLWETTGRKDDLLKAVNYFKKSLDMDCAEKYMLDYAFIKYNMGCAYLELKQENLAAECLTEVKDIYESCLENLDFSKDSYTWSSIQYGLGNTYKLLAKLMLKKEYLERAASAYKEALKIRTIESYPFDYADIHRCMGELYGDMAKQGISKDSLKKALEEYKESLGIYSFEKYPIHYAKVNYEMGSLYMLASYTQEDKLGNFIKANKSFGEVMKVLSKNEIRLF